MVFGAGFVWRSVLGVVWFGCGVVGLGAVLLVWGAICLGNCGFAGVL